jgi:antitoxin HigA-1
MGQIVHGSATTAHAIRTAIQRSKAPLKKKTVAKWRKRAFVKRHSGRCPTHTGALLWEDVIPATGRPRSHKCSVSPASISMMFLRERKPVSPTLAVRLGKSLGDGAGAWIRMQAAYDTWKAERKEDVSKIPALRIKAA